MAADNKDLELISYIKSISSSMSLPSRMIYQHEYIGNDYYRSPIEYDVAKVFQVLVENNIQYKTASKYE